MDQPEKLLALQSCLTFLSDANSQDRVKLKASQELLNNFNTITQSKEVLDYTLLNLINVIKDGAPQFFAESESYQYRKIIFDVIYRLAVNHKLENHHETIFKVMTIILETENEENVLAFLKTIFELLKEKNNVEKIRNFMKYVKRMYTELPNKLQRIFESHPIGAIKEISESLSSVLVPNIFVVSTIPSQTKNPDGTTSSYTFVPKGVSSLKVLQEVPAYLKLVYQMIKSFAGQPIEEQLHKDLSELAPLLIMALTLQPSAQQRKSPNFRKDVFVEFIRTQTRALALLAHLSKDATYKLPLVNNGKNFSKGIVGLFSLCPAETTNLRKEVLVALRSVVDTEIRFLMIPQVENMFNDNYIGDGWTSRETLRNLGYAALGDLIHRIRDKLKPSDLISGVHLFSLNMNDQSLNTPMQIMSCKVIMSIAELMLQRAGLDADPKRELLLRMLHAIVLKCKTIAILEVPIVMKRLNQKFEFKLENVDEIILKIKFQGSAEEGSHNVAELKVLLKTLISGLRTIIIALNKILQMEHDQSIEIVAFTRFVKWSLRAFEIYAINVPENLAARQSFVPSTEDKEALTNFGEIFSILKLEVFEEVFTATIVDIVDKFHNNNAIQIVINYFLTNSRVSSTFATILINYLLERMPDLGSDLERSGIYLRLFKLVFGCVSLFSADNEKILHHNLHKVVERSLKLSIDAENPLNYFLLLRALFRSIGGGTHDKLYQRLLPLLPDLLWKLNQLQSGLHRQFMKDLFIELNLSVPVRLSTLLPYISILMDPLITALNGNDTLIVRGLRTLELCVDNLQTEFLHQHIEPVRAELTHALWKIMRNPSEQIASTAFRLLGKFGGGNRDQMTAKPQVLKYTDQNDELSSIVVDFQENNRSIKFPAMKIVYAAANELKSSDADLFHRRLSWDILYHYLAAAINAEDSSETIARHFSQTFKSTGSERLPTSFLRNSEIIEAEQLQKVALTGIVRALAMDHLGPDVKETSVCMLRHYILMTLAQQAGPLAVNEEARTHILDPCTILVDTITEIMGDEDKDLCRVGIFALFLSLQISTEIFNSVDKASELPLFQHLMEKLSALCYNQAWYAKSGGCRAVQFFVEYMPLRWNFTNYLRLFKASMFVVVDSSDELSYGTVAAAKKNLNMLMVLLSPSVLQDIQDPSISQARTKVLSEVTQELVHHLKIAETSLREQSMESLIFLSKIIDRPMTEVLSTYQDQLKNMIPPKNHVLKNLTIEEQIGLIEGITFCATHAPTLFNIDDTVKRQAEFFEEILTIAKTEDKDLLNQPCYRDVAKVHQLRISVLRLLATCNNIEEQRENIFQVLYNTLTSPDEELQQVAFECTKKFTSGFKLNMEFVHTTMRPLLLTLGDHRNLTLSSVRCLHFLAQLFPNTYNITLCEQLSQHLRKIIESFLPAQTAVSRSNDTTKIIVTIFEIFRCIPAATTKFIDVLCALTIFAEQVFIIENSSPFREPLVKYLLKFPSESLNWLLQDRIIKNHQLSKYFLQFLKCEVGRPFHDLLKNNPARLVTMLLLRFQSISTLSDAEKHEIRFQAVKIISIIVESDEKWLLTQVPLVTALKQNWCNEEFQNYHQKMDVVNSRHWDEPKLMVKILLTFVKHNPDNISLLFDLLRATCNRFMCDFQFLFDFLEHEVAKKYPVEWKRKAFFQFVDLFDAANVTEVLKLKILQLIILPSFAVSFDGSEGTSLIQGVPEPNQDNPRNVVTVFFDRIICLENFTGYSDAIKIFLLRFICLLMEKALGHLKKVLVASETYLRQLIKFARACTTNKNCTDPVTFYLGHLLFSHIVVNFLVSKKMVEHVFINLIKGTAPEAKNIINQALDLLVPVLKEKLGDNNRTLVLSTKKVILEDSAYMYQLTHVLHMVVRHQEQFYSGKQTLMQPLLNSFARLALNPVFEYKKLSIDLAEVMINWELRSMKEGETAQLEEEAKNMTGATPKSLKSYEVYTEVILNYIVRLICRLYEADEKQRKQPRSSYETLFQRCVDLIKIMSENPILSRFMIIKSHTVIGIRDLFYSVNTSQANPDNVCCTLKLLEHLINVMKHEQFLSMPDPDKFQNGLSSCMLNNVPKVVKAVNDFLGLLTRTFPLELLLQSASSEAVIFETLYKSINGFIIKGFMEFEIGASAKPSSLVTKVALMKTMCNNNPMYIDTFINTTMKVFQKLVNGHQKLAADQLGTSSELIITILKVLTHGVGRMSPEMHDLFIETLTNIAEKFQDAEILTAVLIVLESWMKEDKTHQFLSLREKSVLLLKMMQNIEQRFSEDQTLKKLFLELILYIYQEKSLQSSELNYKLESAFLSGLCFREPLMRARFFDLFHASIQNHVYDRLLYIVCSQNWSNMGAYFWIKQCNELLLLTVHQNHNIQLENPNLMLASLSHLTNISGSLMQNLTLNEEEPGLITKDVCDVKYDLREFDLSSQPKKSILQNSLSFQTLSQLQGSFLKRLSTSKTKKFFYLAAQLCYKDTKLAEHIWIDLFPRLWSILEKEQQTQLNSVIVPFICSGIHLVQINCQPSALSTFVEGVTRCKPPIFISPSVMTYVAKTHNLWHRLTLSFEDLALQMNQQPIVENSDLNFEVFESLSKMYDLLCEEDMWSGLWQNNAEYEETVQAITLQQQGCLEDAPKKYCDAMEKFRLDYDKQTDTKAQKEALMWEQQWIKCTRKLCQWNTLMSYANNSQVTDPFLLLECAWKLSDWDQLRETLRQLESNCPEKMIWKINLYRGYLAAYFASAEQNVILTDRYIDVITSYCIREWQKLPEIISHAHLPLLHASQQIIELREAAMVREIVMQHKNTALQDITRTVKTWNYRLPATGDSLDRWSDILTWRQQIFHFIFKSENTQPTETETRIATLAVNASARTIITFSKVARKQHLYNVCMENLQDIYSLPTVPVFNCLMKIVEQVKCYHSLAVSTKDRTLTNRGLELIEVTNVEYFSRKMKAELLALKGMMHAQLENAIDANLWLSGALQVYDNSACCWALWGEHLESRFFKAPEEISLAVDAIICFLHSCKNQNELKSRKYVAKIIWLLNCDDEQKTLLRTFERFAMGITPAQWLSWVPQLLQFLITQEDNVIQAVICQVGRHFPQAIYFEIRTLFLKLKVEQVRKRCIDAQSNANNSDNDLARSRSNPKVLKPTPAMYTCSKIMHFLRTIHPRVLLSLENIVDQNILLRESWHEEILRLLKQCLRECYSEAFKTPIAKLRESKITPSTERLLSILLNIIEAGLDEPATEKATRQSSTLSQTCSKRLPLDIKDTDISKRKKQLKQDFEWNSSDGHLLFDLIVKLKHWIKFFENKIKQLPKTLLISEKYQYLNNVSFKNADIMLPGDFITSTSSNYFIKIAKFLPEVDIVQRNNISGRRIYIRGHNGNLYPYLIICDSGFSNITGEARVLQLFNFLNHYFNEQRETSSRMLSLTVPRIVSISPRIRLIQDNPASLTLLDIYTQYCLKTGIEPDDVIQNYYNRLTSIHVKSNRQRSILADIFQTIQQTLVPKTVLKDWASKTFPSAVDYWMFRKIFTTQLSMINFANYVFDLTELRPDMMNIQKDTGLININFFTFHLSKSVDDQKISGVDKSASFRLTPNLVEFITNFGINGPVFANTIAAARCISQPTFDVYSILRAIFQGEVPTDGVPEEMKKQHMITTVNTNISWIQSKLCLLSDFQENSGQIKELFNGSMSEDCLIRTDPAWYPWL